MKDLEVVLQIAIATGCNQEKPVALALYQGIVSMVEHEKEPRDVEKSKKKGEVTEEEGKAEENKQE